VVRARDPIPETDAAIPIAPDDATRGSRNAPATIVVFSDLQCPFYDRLAVTLDQLVTSYGEDQVRLVFKNVPLPFHQHARLAAEIGQAVLESRGSAAFWRFHDMVFRRQKLMSPETLRAWGMAAGLTAGELEESAMRRASEKVDRDLALAERLDVHGTPASFVNGVRIGGAQPLDKFTEVVDAQIVKAKDLAARGVARDEIYTRLAQANVNVDEGEEGARPAKKADLPDPPDLTVWKVPVGSSPVRGPATALVTIVEFSDFQCPFCRKVEPVLKRLRGEYGDRLRLVWKDSPLPFHPRAVPAARLARAARAQKGDGAFWTVHDKLMEDKAGLEDADLEAVAAATGLDVAKAMAAVRATAPLAALEDDLALSDDLAASGTPHFFVNGRRIVGAKPYEELKPIIDEEISKAKAIVDAGGAKKIGIYDAVVKDGKAPGVVPEQRYVTVGGTAPVRGAATAKVVITQFSDFQCPFCARVEPTLDKLLAAYPGKVKIVWRNLPLDMHPDAALAAEAAREAFVQKGNEGFSKMRELLFKNQSALPTGGRGGNPPGTAGNPTPGGGPPGNAGLGRGALEGYAAQIGLDAAKFAAALDQHTHKAQIDAEKKAAEAAGISGTPGFLVGSYYLAGAQDLRKFSRLVDRVLREPTPPPFTPGPAAGTFPPGLVVTDLAPGAPGRVAKSGDTVRVHYVGKLTTGVEFDSSRSHGDQPFEFDLGKGRVIKGWEAGVVGMKVGGKRKLVIPPDLGYGERGVPPKIPAGSTLVFEIELIGFK